MAAQGTCQLCLQERELRSSHLIPKSTYRLLRNEGFSNPNPFIHGVEHSVQTSKQAQQYLLCSDCEQLFSKRGEAWVMSHCWRSVGDFPIQQILFRSTPIIANDELKIYAGSAIPELDMDKLVYFGASVFWRAAVCEWSFAIATPRNSAVIYWTRRRSHGMSFCTLVFRRSRERLTQVYSQRARGRKRAFTVIGSPFRACTLRCSQGRRSRTRSDFFVRRSLPADTLASGSRLTREFLAGSARRSFVR
jgi:hypothetical protein